MMDPNGSGSNRSLVRQTSLPIPPSRVVWLFPPWPCMGSSKSRVADYAPPASTRVPEAYEAPRVRADDELRVEEDDVVPEGLRKKPRVISGPTPEPQVARVRQRPEAEVPLALTQPRAEQAAGVAPRGVQVPRALQMPSMAPRAVKAMAMSFPDVEVSISSRKMVVYWARLGRQSLQEKLKQVSQKKPVKKKVRVDKLIDLYLDSQEELERMCLEDPEELIHLQIELLTKRIDELEDEMLIELRKKEAAQKAKDEAAKAARQPPKAVEAPKASFVQQAREARAFHDIQVMDWDTVFDKAVAKREHWKKNRGLKETDAQEQWRKKAVMRQPTLASADAKAGKSEVAEQLRREREHLQDDARSPKAFKTLKLKDF